MLDVRLEFIEDKEAQEAISNIVDEFRGQPLLNFLWKFYSVTLTSSVTDYKFRHGLGFKPKDFLITGITGAGTGYFDLDQSDSTFLYITTTDACTIRFLLGNLDENSLA